VLFNLKREGALLVGLKLGVPQCGLHFLPELTLRSSEPLSGRIGKPPPDRLALESGPVCLGMRSHNCPRAALMATLKGMRTGPEREW